MLHEVLEVQQPKQKPGINEALHCLKTCQDLTTNKANESLKILENVSYSSVCSNRHEVAMHLIGKGFGQLFVKMWNSLRGYLDREQWGQRGYEALALMTCCYMNFTDVCPELGAELGKYGCISLMLAGLEKLKVYFNQESEFQIILPVVNCIFGILHNSISLCSINREIYRNVGAVDILKEYLQQYPVRVSTVALMSLAYIVNEEESGILAKSDAGVATLVKLLQKAIESKDHRAKEYHNYFSAFELLNGLNHLAINDDNKREIEKQGGIPTIIRMLQDDFTEEERCVAAEMLWNLTFINHIRQSEQLQDALPGKKYKR